MPVSTLAGETNPQTTVIPGDGLRNFLDDLLAAFDEGGLLEKVAGGISADGQLRKQNHLRTPGKGLARRFYDLF